MSEVKKDEDPISAAFTKVKEFFKSIKKFWRTKRAIDGGEPLYALSAEELKEKNYFGPWAFNGLATLATIVVTKYATSTLMFFLAARKDEVDLKFQAIVDGVPVDEFLCAHEWASSALVPLYTTGLVSMVARASLRDEDSTPENRASARRAFLYFEGSYGVLSQIGLTLFWFAMILWQDVILIAIICIIGCIFRQVYVNAYKIPKLLFKIHGYSLRKRRFWQKRLNDDPPWARVTLVEFLAGPLLFVALNSILMKCALYLVHLLALAKRVTF
jgi:hypothetical protein